MAARNRVAARRSTRLLASTLSLSLFLFFSPVFRSRDANRGQTDSALDVPPEMNRSVSLSRSVTNEKPAVTSFDSRRAREALDPDRDRQSRVNFAGV